MTKEVFDLQETLLWKDKALGALEKQKEHIACLRNERDVLREELADLRQTVTTAEVCQPGPSAPPPALLLF